MPGKSTSSSTCQAEEGRSKSQLTAKLKGINRQVEDINQTLTREELHSMDVADLLVRLDYVDDLYCQYEQAAILVDEQDSSSTSNFLTTYFNVKANIKRTIDTNHSRSMPRTSTIHQFSLDESTNVRKTRLPELKIPQFSGSYTEWPDFFAMFTTVIGNDIDLGKIEKFQHLRACLTGAALDTISSLEPNDDNYEKALSLLKNRFDNKLLNFQAHIKGIFGLRDVEKSSASSLRHLSDKLNAHFRALETMATKEQIADGLLIHIIASKLDAQAQSKWEEGLQSDQTPSFSSLQDFLEKRCRMLENIQSSTVVKPCNKQVSKKPSVRNVLVSSGTATLNCNFCAASDHYITNCNRFNNLSPMARYKEVKKLNLCINCLRKGHRVSTCKSGPCRHCSIRHHSLLHMDCVNPSEPISSTTCSLKDESLVTVNKQPTATVQSTLVSSTSPPEIAEAANEANVFLATAMILIKNKYGVFVPCRAILDSASQLNFISSRLLAQLQLKTRKSLVSISGIGDGNFVADKSANVLIKSCNNEYFVSFDAVVIPNITGYQPNTKDKQFDIPTNINLADPFFNKNGRIDILIGANLFFELMDVGQVKLGNNLPILQKTRLGWVISGGGLSSKNLFSLVTVFNKNQDTENDSLVDVMKGFWEIENEFDTHSKQSIQDEICENHFRQHVTRLTSGEYSVSLPKKPNIAELGGSYDTAYRRFLSIEKKLMKNPDVKRKYIDFMNEYLELNHMSLVTSMPPDIKINYLPHHCVYKEESTTTKLRVVFDGSAKTKSGISLNETLYTGPTIQPKLFRTLLRFRFFKIALSGDICKMYRCVRMSHPDDFLQCILWRDSPSENVKTYKLNTVTYGTKPAAFLAIRAMHQLSADEENAFPIGARIIINNFYVDDLITGGNTIEEVNEIRQQVTKLLARGNFQIRKWCSNNASVLNEIPLSDQERYLKFHDNTDITKTLGLLWDPNSDFFLFVFTHVNDAKSISKRSILSTIARFYDPLGLIGPVITKAKIFMQTLWKSKLDWDESLPQHLHSAWIQFVSTFSTLHKFTFPRFVSLPQAEVQIHAFCDASLSAYGACIYVRSKLNNEIRVNLLCSKSRVAPLKALTIPKLELSAALLLAELLHEFTEGFHYDYECHCWSDSMVVLSWLRYDSAKYNVFVANRVSQIQNLTKNMSWHHIPTALNPADILSRGATPEELFYSKIWKEGPEFLHENEKNWPETANFTSDLPECRRIVLISSAIYDFSIHCKYHNSFPKLQRIFAYVSRFLRYKRGIKFAEDLSGDEIKLGTYTLMRNIQFVHFATEYKALKTKQNISSSSKLLALSPFIDGEGVIRVGGRLENSFLNFSAKHPIIIPKYHPVTSALVLFFHQKLLHAGPQCLLANIRLQYWIIGGRKTVTTIISKCIKCYRLKPKIAQHLMGNLPADRVQQNRIFYTTGIDFCGPFYYKSEIRNRSPLKSYICIFVCFSTKAVHLELVQDLSTASFLSSLKRFISIRGKPNIIWSDNATNFIGAKNELAELRQIFFDQANMRKVYQQCTDDGIKWKFIPPRSPHFGGLWESAVKSAKYHFYRTVGQSILTFDELRTLVYQIAAILNSRPLCPLTESPEDLEVLTPAHFLIGNSLTAIAEPDLTELNPSLLSQWQKVSFMQQVFWKKWAQSYLTLLQERSKWLTTTPNLQNGTLVLIKDENAPPLKWLLGRVLDVIPGSDGIARVAIVKTSNNTFKRAVSKLAVLPIDEYVESHSLPTVGGCSK